MMIHPIADRKYRGWTLEVERVAGAKKRRFRGEALCGIRNVTARDCETEEVMFEVLENMVDAYIMGQEDMEDDIRECSVDDVVTITVKWGYDNEDVFEMFPDSKEIEGSVMTIHGPLKRNETVYEEATVSIPFTPGKQYPYVSEPVPGAEDL